MKSQRRRARSRIVLETLESRIALSHMGAAVEDGPHHNRGGRPAEVQPLRHGADDPANHDANDDNGGVLSAPPGADDPANHDANDDKGGAAVNPAQGMAAATAQAATNNNGVSAQRRGRGADDGVAHNANDDRGGAAAGMHRRHGAPKVATQGHRRGADHPAGHR
jgi:hypothetical protein